MVWGRFFILRHLDPEGEMLVGSYRAADWIAVIAGLQPHVDLQGFQNNSPYIRTPKVCEIIG